MKILFISRAYPPVVGGIENHNLALSRSLQEHVDTKILANRFGKIFLPLFLPYAAIYALIILIKRDTLLLGDGVLGIVGWLVKMIYRDRRRVTCIVHGLDLTYPLPLYQKMWTGHFLPACDQLIAVGNETIHAGVIRGIPESMFTFIPNGIDTDKFTPKKIPLSKLEKLLKADIKGKKILFTGGRLIKRKGVDWFIRNVFPSLPENILYVVSGSGPNLKHIEEAIHHTGMSSRVFILGYISDEEWEVLLNTCDVYIQPNVPVPGDMEGFGLIVLEAASTAVAVVASNIEGLKDAIHDNENGFLVESGHVESFIHIILSLLEDDTARKTFGKKARQYTKENFNWQSITKQYIRVCAAPYKQSGKKSKL